MLSDGPRGYFIHFDNVVVALALLANIVIFAALWRRKFVPTSYRNLLLNLSICDIYISVINLLTLAYQVLAFALAKEFEEGNEISAQTNNIAVHPIFKCVANALKTLQLAGLFANLFNLCSMSIDHLLGVTLPVQYRSPLSDKIACIFIASTWLISFTLAFADIPVNLLVHYEYQISDLSPYPYGANQEDYFMLITMRNRTHRRLSLAKLHSKTTVVPEMWRPVPNDALGSQEDPVNIHLKSGEFHIETTIFTPQSAGILDDFLSAFSGMSPGDLDRNNSHADLLNRTLGLLQGENRSRSSKLQSTKGYNDIGSYCTVFSVKKFWFEMCIIAMVAICFVLLIVCYSVIFCRVTGRFAGSTGKRTRKLIATTIIFLGAFIICWIPFVVFEFTLFLISSKNISGLAKGDLSRVLLAEQVLHSLLIMYPLLDPIIYACRVPTVQQFLRVNLGWIVFCCRHPVKAISDDNSNNRGSASKALLFSLQNKQPSSRRSAPTYQANLEPIK